MMKRCCVQAVLLLLFCLSEAHHEAQAGPAGTLVQQPDHEAQTGPAGTLVQQPDLLWAEMKELRDMVVEQRFQLRNTEARLSASEEDSKELRTTVVEQRVQLSHTEARVAASEEDSKDLRGEVLRLGARVSASEGEAKEQRDMVLRLESTVEEESVQLRIMEGEFQEQRSVVRGFSLRLDATETRLEATEFKVEVLEKESEVGQKVGFSASLSTGTDVYVGSGQTIKFRNIFFNHGNAYNAGTGIFTAPLKGAFQFTFTTFGYSGSYSGAQLLKNGHLQVSTWQSNRKSNSDSTSGAVILSLNAGDRVNLITWDWANMQVFDNENRHTTFSGFLLFPL